jgi:hypothetical protein
MDSVILVVESDRADGLLARLPDDVRVSPAAAGSLAICRDPHCVFWHDGGADLEDFDDAAQAALLEVMKQPRVICIDFSDIRFCREIVVAVADAEWVLVDNDHGLFCTGREFADLVRTHPGWDWRLSPDPG